MSTRELVAHPGTLSEPFATVAGSARVDAKKVCRPTDVPEVGVAERQQVGERLHAMMEGMCPAPTAATRSISCS